MFKRVWRQFCLVNADSACVRLTTTAPAMQPQETTSVSDPMSTSISSSTCALAPGLGALMQRSCAPAMSASFRLLRLSGALHGCSASGFSTSGARSYNFCSALAELVARVVPSRATTGRPLQPAGGKPAFHIAREWHHASSMRSCPVGAPLPAEALGRAQTWQHNSRYPAAYALPLHGLRGLHTAAPAFIPPQYGGYLRTGTAADQSQGGGGPLRVLVTGACGQIGMEMVPYLRKMYAINNKSRNACFFMPLLLLLSSCYIRCLCCTPSALTATCWHSFECLDRIDLFNNWFLTCVDLQAGRH